MVSPEDLAAELAAQGLAERKAPALRNQQQVRQHAHERDFEIGELEVRGRALARALLARGGPGAMLYQVREEVNSAPIVSEEQPRGLFGRRRQPPRQLVGTSGYSAVMEVAGWVVSRKHGWAIGGGQFDVPGGPYTIELVLLADGRYANGWSEDSATVVTAKQALHQCGDWDTTAPQGIENLANLHMIPLP